MKILIVVVILQSILIFYMIPEIIKTKKALTRLIQETAVMWQCLEEKKNI